MMLTTKLQQTLFTLSLLVTANANFGILDDFTIEELKDSLKSGFTLSRPETRSERTFDELVEDLRAGQFAPGSDTPFSKFFKVGRYERALLLEASGDIEHDPSKFVHVIVCQYMLGRYEQAIATCENWLSSHPTAPRSATAFVYEFIGDCRKESGDLQGTIDAFTKALELDSKRDVDTNLENARNLLAVKNNEMSKEDFVQSGVNRKRTSRGLETELSFIRRVRGALFEVPISSKFSGHGKREAWDKASALILQAQELDSSNEFEQAAERYKESLNIYHSDASIWSAYALCLMMITVTTEEEDRKKLKETARALVEAARVGKKDWRVWNNLGVYAMKPDHADATKVAKKCFETALKCRDVPESQRAQLRENLRFSAFTDTFAAKLKKHYGIKTRKKSKK